MILREAVGWTELLLACLRYMYKLNVPEDMREAYTHIAPDGRKQYFPTFRTGTSGCRLALA